MGKDNLENDLWQSFGEQDVTKLRDQLKNIQKLSDKRLRNYSMNTSEHERN